MDAHPLPAPQIVGTRIRECRAASGLSQAELARRVFVSRQTVGNWEAGRTLADVQCLVLLARVFGTTVDDLVGVRNPHARRAGTTDRHALVRLLATAGALLGATLLLVFLAHAVSLLDSDSRVMGALRGCLDLAALACEIVLIVSALPRLRAFMRDQSLTSATVAAAYLEGRDASEPLPDDFLFRWFIPYWKLWLVALVIVVFGAATLFAAHVRPV